MLLTDIRAASLAYVPEKLTTSVSAINPKEGSSVNPDETFTFSVAAQNAAALAGGVQLREVVFHVKVQNDAVAKILAGVQMYSDPKLKHPLAPLTPVKEVYFLGAPGLAPGQLASHGLMGRAGPRAGGGTTNLEFNVCADIDVNWLFAPDQYSKMATKPVTVVG